MRVRTFMFWGTIAAFTGCSAIGDRTVEHTGEDRAAIDTFACVDPPDYTEEPGTPGTTTTTTAPDGSPLVDYVHSLGAKGLSFDASSLAQTTSLRVRVEIDEESIHADAEGSYAVVMLDDVRVNVVNARSPRDLPTADLGLDVGTRDLLGLSLIATYRPSSAGMELSIAAEADASGAGAGVPLGPTSISSMGGCTADAFAGLVGAIPADMPPIHFPKMTDCSHSKCVEIRRSWIHGHIEVFYAHLVVEYVAAVDAVTRSYVWGRPGRDASHDLTSDQTAPSYWFGDYDGDRFDKIREGVNKLWDVYRTRTTGLFNIPMRHHCPVAADVGNVCFNFDVPAHHWVQGRVEYCDSFFGHGWDWQAYTSVHEPMHHLWVGAHMVGDVHTHRHGPSCLSPVTESIYGEEAHELATYLNSNGSSCSHRNVATRTIDSYAQMIRHLGGGLLDGSMVSWPAWGDPTPQPPNCDPADRGLEGCECAPVNAFGDDSTPDGNDSKDHFCYDDGHEVSCVKTKFNATDTVGICTRCDTNFRAPGCSCQHDDDCADGLFCYGSDTANGAGVGHCYSQTPPSWACLADCQALFNDPQAVCLYNRPGGARCLDSGCDEEKELFCMSGKDPHGNVCRDGACVVECHTQQDCQDLHFPAAFECINNYCQQP